ncbi:4Fe-4S dicluster domain-containing protein [Haliovirga abyssi]|uniref:4Fe-4S ferredoxin-type domain-containing protein n=1 Tax=Haliovirga abyssi TaxID=2996794 RepID=A0AAU9DXS4_9FUSO|nr:4Fe-4S dicluster domain-containing protein [Haliovirga abyssi]BDU51301.1 hypothetical protein HLVA_18700 [Haliovirga abyssi]
MAKNWYPIISGKCTKCMACVVVCPLGLLVNENNQINLINSEKCPVGCTKCSDICTEKVINYFDGTDESIMKAFSGSSCSCGTH